MSVSLDAFEALKAIGACRSQAQMSRVCRVIERGCKDGLISRVESEWLDVIVSLRTPKRRRGGLALSLGCVTPFMPRGRQASPDRAASRERRRMLGGSNALPAGLRRRFTEGQRAVLTIIAGEVKRVGWCETPIDAIAARAGVCRTTVQSTLYEAARAGAVRVTRRPRRGQKSLTNIVEIVSREWSRWLARGLEIAREVGSKFENLPNPSEKQLLKKDGNPAVVMRGEARRRRFENYPEGMTAGVW